MQLNLPLFFYKKVFPFFIITFLAVGFFSCQKSPMLSIDSKSEIELTANDNKGTITFTANRDWNVFVSESWVHVDLMNGTASDGPITLTVTYDPNPTYDDRVCTVTIHSGELSQSVSIIQPAKQGLIVEGRSDFFLAPEAQSLEIEVKANVDYSVSTSADWIKLVKTKALTSNYLSFTIEENLTFEERSATISISGGGLSQEISVKQDAAIMNMSRKLIKSVTMETDYPDLKELSDMSLLLTYDDDKRLTKVSGGMGDEMAEVISYQYSGNTINISFYREPVVEARLDGKGKFSSLIPSNGGQSLDLSYDSEERLISAKFGEGGIQYQWKGNDLYAFKPAGLSGDGPFGFHFEPSDFLAPAEGVDINMLIRLFAYEIGFGEILEDFLGMQLDVDGTELMLFLLPGMIGKRSEHVLAIRIDDITIPASDYLYQFISHDAEFKVSDGSWQKFDRNISNNWPYGPGTFEIRCSGIPYQYQSKPWTWVSEDGLIMTQATFPITFNLASCTGELVAYNVDYDHDGVINPWEVAFKTQNVNVTPTDSSEEYSVRFAFDYY